MCHLILLEDEFVLRQELTEFLMDIGYSLDAVADLASFRQVYDSTRHRIAVVDLSLPDGDGMDLIRELRNQGNAIGIVVLTARGGTRNKVLGLGDGADYFLDKTADLDELAATLSALSRRLGVSERDQCWVLEASPRRLFPPGHNPIPLSQQDLIVLKALMSCPGENVSRQRIVAALGQDFLVYDQRRLDTQMRRLRRKVTVATGIPLPVNTARNSGYCFHAEAEIRERGGGTLIYGAPIAG